MKKIQKAFLPLVGLVLITGSSLSAAKIKFNYATFAPHGTVWVNYMKKAKREIEKKTKAIGKPLKFRIFAGGTAGSELSVVSKLRRGARIQMASMTGLGLGKILPEIRVLELPFFFKNSKQVDRVVNKLYPRFKKGFDKKGFILAGWGEIGEVYVMSKKPLRSYKDMKGIKIWAPVGDKLVRSMFEEYGLVPVYLSFEQVLPQLQTGGLDAYYAPPVAAIGLQWFNEVKYVTNVQLAVATGANLINKKKFNKLPAEVRKILMATSLKYGRKLVIATRAANKRGLKTLKRKLKFVKIKGKDLADLKKKAKRIQTKLISKGLYSQRLLNLAKAAR